MVPAGRPAFFLEFSSSASVFGLMHSRFGVELRMGFSRGVGARFRGVNLVGSLGFDEMEMEMVLLRVGSRDLNLVRYN